MRWVLPLLTLVVAQAFATDLPRENRVPGGIAIVPIGVGSNEPRADFGNYRAAVVKQKDRWIAIVGIPLATAPGLQKLRVSLPGGVRDVTFRVIDKRYRTQELHIENQRQVDPLPEDLLRIERERVRSDAALGTFSTF